MCSIPVEKVQSSLFVASKNQFFLKKELFDMFNTVKHERVAHAS